MADYTQPDDATRRVRFFDGQFLQDQDFADEQKYHIDRHRRLARTLHVTGVVEGFGVRAEGANRVRVTAGTAIDDDGRFVVLAEDRLVDLPAATFNSRTGVRVVAVFREQEAELATTGSRSERRWLEDPQVVAIAPDGTATEAIKDPSLPPVALAELGLDKNGVVTVDNGPRQVAGARLPGRVGIGFADGPPAAPLEVRGGIRFGGGPVGGAELSSGADTIAVSDNARLPRLAIAQATGNVGIGTTTPGDFRLNVNGRARIDGADYKAATVLSVAPGTVQLDAPNVPGGRLHLDGGTGNLGVGTNQPGDFRLHVAGRARVGNADTGTKPQLSVAPGTVQFDAPNVAGGRLHVDGGTGNVGVGTNNPGSFKLYVNGRARLGGVEDHKADPVLSVAPGTVTFDAPNVVGGRLVIDGANNRVGINAPTPRTDLDTGRSLVSGSLNDYLKGQFTMSGGGTVSWGGGGQRLRWTRRFIAISAERGRTFGDGYCDIAQPTTPIPAANVYDGQARPADATGVVLNDWEALFAVHAVGLGYTSVTFQIKRYTHEFHAPSNWILVAVVNGDDDTVKLGTGVTLAARSSSTKGSPIPVGTITMWSGSARDIPDGWALCNGQGPTPDLRSRFLVGAGDGNPPYQPNQSGEADSHTHRVTLPTGAFSTSANGAHDHGPPQHWYNRDLLGDAAAAGKSWYSAIDAAARDVRSARGTTDGSHSHTLNVNLPAIDSAGGGGLNRPKWYALCFIMKL